MKAKRVELRADIDIKALTCDPAAGRAYRKLVEAGAKAAALEQGVGMVVLTYKLPRSFDALAVPGMTRKKLDGFPNELRSVARDAELLGEHPYFGNLESVDFRSKVLSSLLRSYADHCEDVIQSFRAWMKRNPRYFDLQSIFKTKLLRYIKSATGGWHYEWTSDLINGALALAASEEEEYKSNVTPAALRQLVNREISKEERRKKYRRMARAMDS